jgi:hypothetical protein
MADKVSLQITGGGVFSKMMLAIQSIAHLGYELENCYLNIVDDRALSPERTNPLDSIIDQSYDSSYIPVGCIFAPSYNSRDRVEESGDYEKLKRIASQLKYKPELSVLVDDYVYLLGIKDNTIGVHIRLCDMNIIHGADYGVLTFNDYLEAIQEELKSNNANIFVASDNEESILKLKAIFGNRISYVPNLIRAKTEIEDSSVLQSDNFKSTKFWQEAFLEMLLLSKCSTLICRTSNVANMAIISSNSIKKITMS